MQLNDALGRISEIRAQLDRTETYRGFRSLTVGLSGVFGLVAALLQTRYAPRPTEQVWSFIDLWVIVAALSVLVVGVEIAWHWSATSSPLKRRLTLLAIQQFVPCLIAGAAVTVIIGANAPQAAWMLPGLWAILFSLGILACCRLLPRATLWVGVHYMASGSICLALGRGDHALSPWMMAGTFGLGQLLAAAVLYYCLERTHEPLEA